jgi:hypothetical protein
MSGRNVPTSAPIQFSADEKFLATLATLRDFIASEVQARDEQ